MNFTRKYSNEKTDECPVPYLYGVTSNEVVWTESDAQFRDRIKAAIEAEKNSFEARYNRYAEYLEHADCITTTLLAECERLRLECVPDCQHPSGRWRNVTFSRGAAIYFKLPERGVECGVCFARLMNGEVHWRPKSEWIKDK